MFKREAGEYLAEVIANYIEDDFTITHLTGEGCYGEPDQEHKEKLAQALRAFGYTTIASRLEN